MKTRSVELSQHSTSCSKAPKPDFLKNTFTHKIGNEPKRQTRPLSSKGEGSKQIDTEYQIYYSLKTLQTATKRPQQAKQPRPLSKITLYRNHFERKRLVEIKESAERQFLLRKSELMAVNKAELARDLTALGRISEASFKHFRRQIDMYNKYYSNFISDESPLELGTQPDLAYSREPIRKIDLNLKSRPEMLFRQDDSLQPSAEIQRYHSLASEVENQKFTFKRILQYDVPEDIFNSPQLIEKKKELKKYNISSRHFDGTLTLLKDQSQRFSVALPDELSREFLRAVRRGDDVLVGYFLSQSPQLISATDELNQSALHWAAKRNNEHLVQMLINKGAVVEHEDSLGRTAQRLASTHGHHRVAKILQLELKRPVAKETSADETD